MPLNMSLNFSPLGMQKKQFGARLPLDMNNGQSMGGSDIGLPNTNLPTQPQSQPQSPIPVPSIMPGDEESQAGPQADSTTGGAGKNWFALLAPIISAGLGYAVGGKAGAAVGFSGGAQAGANFVTERTRQQQYQDVLRQKGIENTQRQQQLDIQTSEQKRLGETTKSQLKQSAIENYLATGQDPDNVLTEQEKAGATEKESRKVFNDWSEKIDKAPNSGTLSSYPEQVQGERHLSPAQKAILVQSVQKALPVVQQKEQTAKNIGESNVESGASLRAQREADQELRAQASRDRQRQYLENSADKDTPYEIVALGFDDPSKPFMTKEQYDALRNSRQAYALRNHIRDQVIASEKQAAALVGKEIDAYAYVKADKIAQDAVASRYGPYAQNKPITNKVDQAVELLTNNKVSEEDGLRSIKEKVQNGTLTEQEGSEIARRMGWSVKPPASTSSVMDLLPRQSAEGKRFADKIIGSLKDLKDVLPSPSDVGIE